MFVRILLILLLLGLEGCATSLNVQYQNLDSKAVCCDTYKQMTFDTNLGFKTVNLKFNQNSKVFKFKQGKSYFNALVVNGTHQNYKVISYFSGFYVHQYISPVILELDKNYKVISRRELAMHFTQGLFFEGAHLQRNIELNKKTKYLIIYLSNIKSNRQIYIKESGYAYSTGGSAVVMPSVSSYENIDKSPTGELQLIPTI